MKNTDIKEWLTENITNVLKWITNFKLKENKGTLNKHDFFIKRLGKRGTGKSSYFIQNSWSRRKYEVKVVISQHQAYFNVMFAHTDKISTSNTPHGNNFFYITLRLGGKWLHVPSNEVLKILQVFMVFIWKDTCFTSEKDNWHHKGPGNKVAYYHV